MDSLDLYASVQCSIDSIIWDSAENFNIYDLQGNKFIDFTSAIFFVNVGHSNERASNAIKSVINLFWCYAYGNEIRENI